MWGKRVVNDSQRPRGWGSVIGRKGPRKIMNGNGGKKKRYGGGR